MAGSARAAAVSPETGQWSTSVTRREGHALVLAWQIDKARRRRYLSRSRSGRGRMKNLARSVLLAALFAIAAVGESYAAEPIKIGFSMELTGPFAVVGKTGLLAFKIWEDEVNAEGGLLGRPVKLVYYDDQSNPALVPAIYTKLIDIDKVDLLISSYGTNLVVPAMPVAIAHNRLFFGLFALAANDKFHYPKYFSMLPFGPEPVKTFAEGWFDLAAAQKPQPKTVAIVAADAEFQHKAAESAREWAKAKGFDIVYDRAYPPNTVDFTPIVNAVKAAKPDLVYIASYPSDTVGMLRSIGEIGLDAKMVGGGLAGLQAAAIKMELGKAANGVVNVDLWEPVPTMQFPGVMDFLKKYQAKAPEEGIDRLGYFLPPFAYSELQILGQAIEATKTVDNDKLAEYMHSHPFHTIEGDISFGREGEWTAARPIWVQYHGIEGHGLEQFRGSQTVTILAPAQFKTGDLVYPYSDARK
jgi:branched-chain amino acid transport system substrate-binding protein